MWNRSRPVLDIPLSPFEAFLVILSVLGIITVLAITWWAWSALPAIIPTHSGLSGALNASGGKVVLLIFPILSIGLAVLLAIVSRFPHTYNYPWPITEENAPRQYFLARLLLRWITLEVVWTFCGVQWALIQAAQTHSAGAMFLFAPAIVLALFVTIAWHRRAASRAR
jgi:uncharacterized membrane protein